MSSHLIYHPARVRRVFGKTSVYFDSTAGNQDPFIWNRSFLHTYCHMTQLRDPQPGDINFWVSSTALRSFTHLVCDLVFVVAERVPWKNRNRIVRSDPMIDSEVAYQDHYRWVRRQHFYKRRLRKTLKADPDSSFQPQAADGRLIDIVPMLARRGYPLAELHHRIINGHQSKPMPIEKQDAKAILQAIQQKAKIRLQGATLQSIRRRHPELHSRWR